MLIADDVLEAVVSTLSKPAVAFGLAFSSL